MFGPFHRDSRMHRLHELMKSSTKPSNSSGMELQRAGQRGLCGRIPELLCYCKDPKSYPAERHQPQLGESQCGWQGEFPATLCVSNTMLRMRLRSSS